MNEHESPIPEVSDSDNAIIRDIMEKHGLDFNKARLVWQYMKFKNQEEIQDKKEK